MSCYNKRPAWLSHLGLAVAISVSALLCGLNVDLVSEISRQSVVSSVFCVFGGVLYIVYMIISKAVAIVITYTEVKADDEDEDNMFDTEPLQYSDDHKSDYHTAVLPRSAVVSSMYLGGIGMFLAIPSLCMWDQTVSATFVMSVALISVMDATKINVDFRPNVDTVAAIWRLRLFRTMTLLSIIGTLISVVFLDTRERWSQYTGFLNQTSVTIIVTQQQWPLLLLAASSPLLLRASGTAHF